MDRFLVKWSNVYEAKAQFLLFFLFGYLIGTVPEINHSLEAPIIARIHLRKTSLEDKFEPVKPTEQKDTITGLKIDPQIGENAN